VAPALKLGLSQKVTEETTRPERAAVYQSVPILSGPRPYIGAPQAELTLKKNFNYGQRPSRRGPLSSPVDVKIYLVRRPRPGRTVTKSRIQNSRFKKFRI
jgi:hypothetical protein